MLPQGTGSVGTITPTDMHEGPLRSSHEPMLTCEQAEMTIMKTVQIVTTVFDRDQRTDDDIFPTT